MINNAKKFILGYVGMPLHFFSMLIYDDDDEQPEQKWVFIAVCY